MKLRKPTLVEIGGIVAMLWIAYQFFQSLWPNGPDLVAFEQTTDIGLPASHLRFLQDMDMSRGDLKAIVSVAEAAKEQHKDTYGKSGTLDALKEFSLTIPVLGPLQSQITTVKIVNNGRKPATNVKVFFPSSGLAVIESEGASPRMDQTKGRVDLQSLEPGSQCVVRLWPSLSGNFRDIRVVSDEGPAPVRSATVSTEASRWMIGFGMGQAVIVVLVAVVLFQAGFRLGQMRALYRIQ
jgi:hypothetical protein